MQCASGTLQCVVDSPCEVCNGLDDDGDGRIDEGNPGGDQPCDVPVKLGVCRAGETACRNGIIVCVQITQPSAEVCDGLDNNCNGGTDEGC